jgi:hypothetical protein
MGVAIERSLDWMYISRRWPLAGCSFSPSRGPAAWGLEQDDISPLAKPINPDALAANVIVPLVTKAGVR